LHKYTGIKCYADYRELLSNEALDAVFIATPSHFHAGMVRAALERNLHIFCEKPFCLDINEGLALAQIAETKALVNQVGYHFRFIAAFEETKRLLEAGVIGTLHHVRAEAYGPVVLRPQGSTWRQSKDKGGGCLYDYACHAVDLMNYLVGPPDAVGGTVLNNIFSRNVEDEVYATFYYPGGRSGQIIANWSDESLRKMTSRITLWGTKGRITADRQEIQLYLREAPDPSLGLSSGWNIRYTTELTKEVWFYLRGEEYSAQIDHFVQHIKTGKTPTRSSFRSALETDVVVSMMLKDAASSRVHNKDVADHTTARPSRFRIKFGRLFG
jgi:predicted dehydrogenase